MRRHNRKDNAHKPIVEGLRARGVGVVDMADPGDILCYYEGRFMPLEIKSADSHAKRGADGKPELTPAQKRTRELGVPIPVVESVTEAWAFVRGAVPVASV